MRITKSQAIKECKEMWAEIEKSGCSDKMEFLFTKAGRKWREKMYCNGCPLCEYALARPSSDCIRYCPLVKQYGEHCVRLGYTENITRFIEVVKGLK